MNWPRLVLVAFVPKTIARACVALALLPTAIAWSPDAVGLWPIATQPPAPTAPAVADGPSATLPPPVLTVVAERPTATSWVPAVVAPSPTATELAPAAVAARPSAVAFAPAAVAWRPNRSEFAPAPGQEIDAPEKRPARPVAPAVIVTERPFPV